MTVLVPLERDARVPSDGSPPVPYALTASRRSVRAVWASLSAGAPGPAAWWQRVRGAQGRLPVAPVYPGRPGQGGAPLG